ARFMVGLMCVCDRPFPVASPGGEPPATDAHSSASLLLSAKLKISFSVVQVHAAQWQLDQLKSGNQASILDTSVSTPATPTHAPFLFRPGIGLVRVPCP